MASRFPVVMSGGQLQQLQSADAIVAQGPNAPGSISIADGQFMVFASRLTLTGSQRATVAGAGHVAVI